MPYNGRRLGIRKTDPDDQIGFSFRSRIAIFVALSDYHIQSSFTKKHSNPKITPGAASVAKDVPVSLQPNPSPLYTTPSTPSANSGKALLKRRNDNEGGANVSGQLHRHHLCASNWCLSSAQRIAPYQTKPQNEKKCWRVFVVDLYA